MRIPGPSRPVHGRVQRTAYDDRLGGGAVSEKAFSLPLWEASSCQRHGSIWRFTHMHHSLSSILLCMSPRTSTLDRCMEGRTNSSGRKCLRYQRMYSHEKDREVVEGLQEANCLGHMVFWKAESQGKSDVFLLRSLRGPAFRRRLSPPCPYSSLLSIRRVADVDVIL